MLFIVASTTQSLQILWCEWSTPSFGVDVVNGQIEIGPALSAFPTISVPDLILDTPFTSMFKFHLFELGNHVSGFISLIYSSIRSRVTFT